MIVQRLSLPILWRTFREKILRRKFVHDVGALVVANCGGAGLSLIQGLLVARWLGPEQYGISALVMSYPGLVYTFFDAHCAEASVKYLSEFHAGGDRNRVLAMCKLGYAVDLGIAISTFIVVSLTAPWAARGLALHPGTGQLIIVYTAAFIPRALQGTSYSVLATLGRFSVIAWLDIVTVSARAALVLGLVFFGWQVAGVVWGNALAIVLNGILYLAAAHTLSRRAWDASPLQGDWKALKGRKREIFGFLAYNDLTVLLGMIPKQLDVLLLGYFRNPTQVGYYKLAQGLASTVGYLVRPLQSVIYPRLSFLAGAGRQSELNRLVRQAAFSIGAPLACLTLIAIPVLPVLVSKLLATYMPAVFAAQIMTAGMAVWLAFFWLRPTYMALGEVSEWFKLNLVGASILLVGMFIVTSFWGYIGLAFWIMAGQVWGQGLFAGWLILRRWRLAEAVAKPEAV